MTERPGAVLFDCDGVLVDSEPPMHRLIAAELQAAGLAMDEAEVTRRYIGATLGKVRADVLAQGIGLPEDWADRVYDKLFVILERGVPLIPGVVAVLDALDAAGIPYAVGSNGRPRKMEITLGQHPALRDRFGPHLYSGQALGAPKPDPRLYLHAAAALGVAPERCAVVDDSANGCLAGVRAGMRVLGYAAHDDGAGLAALGAEVFHDMGELPRLLGL